MIQLGSTAPDFALPAANPDVDERGSDEKRRLADYDDADVLVVVFMCNHCPYVKHVEDELLQVARDYAGRSVQFVGICSNNAETHPQDSFENIAERALEKDYPFPYLRDESQEVASDYGAVCTPDFFVYNDERRLVYRGRFDESRPNQGPPTGEDLRQAIDDLLEEGRVFGEQYPSVGCNIKWKPGMEPA
jgi:thiol-disulfide isomerase/thioredoxin